MYKKDALKRRVGGSTKRRVLPRSPLFRSDNNSTNAPSPLVHFTALKTHDVSLTVGCGVACDPPVYPDEAPKGSRWVCSNCKYAQFIHRLEAVSHEENCKTFKDAFPSSWIAVTIADLVPSDSTSESLGDSYNEASSPAMPPDPPCVAATAIDVSAIVDASLVVGFGTAPKIPDQLVDNAASFPRQAMLEPPSRWTKAGTYYTRCPCPLVDCDNRVNWSVRYLMNLDCTKKVIGYSYTQRNVASSKSKSGTTTERISSYHSDETVDENGVYTGKEITVRGRKLPDIVRIHKNSRLYNDFEDWFQLKFQRRQQDLEKKNEGSAKWMANMRTSMSEEEFRVYIEQSNERNKERSKIKYQKDSNENIRVKEARLINENGGWTEEYQRVGMVNVFEDYVEKLRSPIIEQLHAMMKKEPGSLIYVFKATAECMDNSSMYLHTKELNIAGNEHFRFLIQGCSNNIILQGSDGDEGNTVPLHWTTDGTIKYEVIGYTQTNGAQLAYNIESDLIQYVMNKYPMGINCANRGLYRGHGEDRVGVYVAAILIITNAKELHESGKFAFSSNISESNRKTIKHASTKHPNVYQFVDPCSEKKAAINNKIRLHTTSYPANCCVF